MVRSATLRPPSTRLATIRNHVDRPEWRATWWDAARVSVETAAVYGLSLWAMRAGALWVASALWGGAGVRSFIHLHDAGHGSFVPRGNALALAVWSACVMTPTSWAVGHHLHHRHVGNRDQDVYDWGDTVFHTTQEYAAMTGARRALYRVVRHPLLFFTCAPALYLWVALRLPFQLHRMRYYTLQSKLWSAAWLALRYSMAWRCGVLSTVLCGDYGAMVVGFLLFHWQHVFNPGYVKSRGSEWNRSQAALRGSSCLVLPEWCKWFTVGIEYHHIHHLTTRIPGHMLRACHEAADPGLWAGVPVLRWPQMWESLWLALWCDERQRYVGFADCV